MLKSNDDGMDYFADYSAPFDLDLDLDLFILTAVN